MCTPDLPNEYHGATSFQLVHAAYTQPIAPYGHVCMYTQTHYQGESKCFASDSDLCYQEHGGCGSEWNDHVCSILFGPDVTGLKLYEHSGYATFLAELAAAHHSYQVSITV